MGERIRDSLAHARDQGVTGPADEVFLARVRNERSRRRRPMIAAIGAGLALAACAALAVVVLRPVPTPPVPQAEEPTVAEAPPERGTVIEPAKATLATLLRLNADGDLDSLVLSRADCVAWTRAVSPLGR